MKDKKDEIISPKNVGVWIRVSSDEQAKGDSPEHHLERARARAASQGWIIKEVYNLSGVSGKSVKDHPECKRMLADIKRKHISVLLFSKLARLARNTIELLEFSKYFETHGADLVSMSETIDTGSPAGRLFFTVIAAMATWEREEIGDRQKASVLVRAKLGKTINGSAPYGYQWKDRKLVIHPEEAPIRRKAFEMFLEYRRKGTVAKLLNADGYRTRNKSLFSDTQIGRILICPSAKGLYQFNRFRKTGSWAGTEKPEEEWGQVECEPIVSAEIWNQVNQIIETTSKEYKRPGKVPVNPFGNRIWCGCGSRCPADARGCDIQATEVIRSVTDVHRYRRYKIPVYTLSYLFFKIKFLYKKVGISRGGRDRMVYRMPPELPGQYTQNPTREKSFFEKKYLVWIFV